MDNTFEDMFSKKADDISNGYYFYKVKHELFEKQDELAKHESSENHVELFTDFKYAWNCKKLQEVFAATFDLEQIVNKIAIENKPFLEISCGNSMGLTPFILKLNPQIQCLVTDIDDTIIKGWRKFIDEPSNKLQNHHISLARFDNCDIPIKNDSFDYVTCTLALNYLYNENNDKFKKALEEIHRVLKKGGSLLAVEHTPNCEFDMTRIYQECQPRGAFYGLYTYEVMEQIYKEYQDKKLQRDQFTVPGFEIELEVDDEDIKQYSDKYAFEYISHRAIDKYNIFENSTERFIQKQNLLKSAPYLGIKCTLEKYFLVMRKL